MDTLANWLSFAALVYVVGVKATWWPGPITTYRRSRQDTGQDTTSRWARLRLAWSPAGTGQDNDPPDAEGRGSVPSPGEWAAPVEWAPGVTVSHESANHGLRIIRAPAGPRPLEELLSDRGITPATNGSPASSRTASKATTAEIRAYVRRRQAERPRPTPTQIDRDGAQEFGCSTKSIQRARLMLERKHQRLS